jgi:hypothetical protein
MDINQYKLNKIEEICRQWKGLFINANVAMSAISRMFDDYKIIGVSNIKFINADTGEVVCQSEMGIVESK